MRFLILPEAAPGKAAGAFGIRVRGAMLLLAAGLGACAAHSSSKKPWPKEPYSMLELAVACDREPSELDAWFPVRRYEGPDARPGHRCVNAAVLRSYQEPILAAESSGETYRLIYMPSFAPPVVVRLEAGTGTPRITAKRDRAQGEQLTGSFETTAHSVDPAGLAAVRRALDSADCWTPGSACRGQSEDGKDLGDGKFLMIVDGSDWILEGTRGTEHWAVEVSHPEDGPFLEACWALVDAADARAWIPEERHRRNTAR